MPECLGFFEHLAYVLPTELPFLVFGVGRNGDFHKLCRMLLLSVVDLHAKALVMFSGPVYSKRCT